MLLVDIGNTRVKWAACGADGTLAAQQAASHAAWTAREWRDALFRDAGVDRVVAASVAGDASRRKLEEAAAACGVTRVEFVASTAAAAGVVNAYPNPRLLGVDRWVALIGAYSRVRRACCIVDVGTAMTIDAVTDAGRHLGGFIVPGPQLMANSLFSSTSDLAAHAAASVANEHGLFADNTSDAILRGSRVALGALIDRAVAELAHVSATAPVLLVTGGAAHEVAPYVLAPVTRVADLVLHGLARLAREQG